MLYQIQHDHKAGLWCGLAALATITGRPTSECRRAVLLARERSLEKHFGPSHHNRPRNHVTGMQNWEMQGALDILGYRMVQRDSFVSLRRMKRPTLAKYLRGRTGHATSATLLIEVTRHYVVVEGKRFVDNTQTNPVFIRDAKGRRKRVNTVWIVSPKGAS